MADKPTPEQLNARLAKSPYNSWLGLTVTSVGEDTIEMTAKWREEWVVNPAGGYTHGGILAALVDVVADYAIAVKNGNPVPTIDLRVDYHRAAKGDLKVFGQELAATVNPLWLLRSLPNNVLGHLGIRQGSPKVRWDY